MARIRSARPARHQVMARSPHKLPDAPIRRSEIAYQYALVILRPSLEHRRDEGDAEAAAPVAAEVGQARPFVVFVLRQIRVRQLAHRNEHERVTETLKASRECEVEI